MLLVGKTQAGSAGAQPARDSQLNATNCRWDGSLVPSDFTNFADNSELCYALKNPIKRVPPKADTLFAEGKKSLLTKKWVCPFHAEPVRDYHAISTITHPNLTTTQKASSFARVRLKITLPHFFQLSIAHSSPILRAKHPSESHFTGKPEPV